MKQYVLSIFAEDSEKFESSALGESRDSSVGEADRGFEEGLPGLEASREDGEDEVGVVPKTEPALVDGVRRIVGGEGLLGELE